MKKHCVIFVAVMAVTLAVFASDSQFTNALRNCSQYSESGSVNAEGMNVHSIKQITGKQGDKCVYKETVNMSGPDITITCKFTDTQRYELVSVMDAYDLVQKYSKDNVDTTSVSAVQDNPVVRAWNKYLQDTSVCTLSGPGINGGK